MNAVRAAAAKAAPTASVTAGASLALQRKCACGGSAGMSGECSDCRSEKLTGQRIQTKLRINEPGDEYEREADRVAEEVMRMAAPAQRDGVMPSQRTPLVQRRVYSSGDGAVGEAPGVVHEVLASSGQPLDTRTRGFFEARLGHDLSAVRIHTGIAAAGSAQAVGASAYTVGHQIVFGAHRYLPHSAAGRALIAHELAHVIQQRDSWSSRSSGSSPTDSRVLQRQSLWEEAGSSWTAVRGAMGFEPSAEPYSGGMASGTAATRLEKNSAGPDQGSRASQSSDERGDVASSSLELAEQWIPYAPSKLALALETAIALERMREQLADLPAQVESCMAQQLKGVDERMDQLVRANSPAWFAEKVYPILKEISLALLEGVPQMFWGLVRDAVFPFWGIIWDDLPSMWRGLQRAASGKATGSDESSASWFQSALGVDDFFNGILSALGRLQVTLGAATWLLDVLASGTVGAFAGGLVSGVLSGGVAAPEGGGGGAAVGEAVGAWVTYFVDKLETLPTMALTVASDTARLAAQLGHYWLADIDKPTQEAEFKDLMQTVCGLAVMAGMWATFAFLGPRVKVLAAAKVRAVFERPALQPLVEEINAIVRRGSRASLAAGVPTTSVPADTATSTVDSTTAKAPAPEASSSPEGAPAAAGSQRADVALDNVDEARGGLGDLAAGGGLAERPLPDVVREARGAIDQGEASPSRSEVLPQEAAVSDARDLSVESPPRASDAEPVEILDDQGVEMHPRIAARRASVAADTPSSREGELIEGPWKPAPDEPPYTPEPQTSALEVPALKTGTDDLPVSSAASLGPSETLTEGPSEHVVDRSGAAGISPGSSPEMGHRVRKSRRNKRHAPSEAVPASPSTEATPSEESPRTLPESPREPGAPRRQGFEDLPEEIQSGIRKAIEGLTPDKQEGFRTAIAELAPENQKKFLSAILKLEPEKQIQFLNELTQFTTAQQRFALRVSQDFLENHPASTLEPSFVLSNARDSVRILSDFAKGAFPTDEIKKDRWAKEPRVEGRPEPRRWKPSEQFRPPDKSSTSPYELTINEDVLKLNVEQFQKMGAALSSFNPDYVVGEERGGPWLAEATMGATGTKVNEVWVPSSKGFTEMKAQVRSRLTAGKKTKFAFFEVSISGSSSNKLYNALFDWARAWKREGLNSSLFEFRVFVMRESAGYEPPGELGGPEEVRKATERPKEIRDQYGDAIQYPTYFDVPLIVGEDSTTILSRQASKPKPIFIFDNEGIITRVIEPNAGETPRQLVLRLLSEGSDDGG